MAAIVHVEPFPSPLSILFGGAGQRSVGPLKIIIPDNLSESPI